MRRSIPPSLAGYPGAKTQAGVYQWQINLIPPHRVWVDLFAGSCTVWSYIRPAEESLGVEIDPVVVRAWESNPGILMFHQDAFQILEKSLVNAREDVFVYADPPYLLETRRSCREIYSYELTDGDHRRLLGLLKKLKCPVMLCGYPSKLYDDLLPGWGTSEFATTTRAGLAVEKVWMNYRRPAFLHDYRFVGEDKREREVIKRRGRRLVASLERRPVHERLHVLAGLMDQFGHELGGYDDVVRGRRLWRPAPSQVGKDGDPVPDPPAPDPSASDRKNENGTGRQEWRSTLVGRQEWRPDQVEETALGPSACDRENGEGGGGMAGRDGEGGGQVLAGQD